jgi:ferric-dicitrate binding protein FerR (iron transport regulator)
MKDKDKPFIVLTNNAKTTVLGTKFNVYNRGEKTEVIVKEGLVNLAPLKSENKGINLSKDELSFISNDKNTHTPEKVDPDYRLGWLKGKLVFDNTPLNNVIDELVRFYDIPIAMKGIKYQNSGLTGTFSDQSLEDVLSMICLTFNLDYKKNEKGYYINEK